VKLQRMALPGKRFAFAAELAGRSALRHEREPDGDRSPVYGIGYAAGPFRSVAQ
jgi:hypothetical protein